MTRVEHAQQPVGRGRSRPVENSSVRSGPLGVQVQSEPLDEPEEGEGEEEEEELDVPFASELLEPGSFGPVSLFAPFDASFDASFDPEASDGPLEPFEPPESLGPDVAPEAPEPEPE